VGKDTKEMSEAEKQMSLIKLRDTLYKQIRVDDVELYENGAKLIAFLSDSTVNLDKIRELCLKHNCTAEITMSSDKQSTFIRFYSFSTKKKRLHVVLEGKKGVASK
jgi:hypothetical protein